MGHSKKEGEQQTNAYLSVEQQEVQDPMVIGDEPVARDGESDWYETVVGTSKRQEYTCSDGD